MSSLCNRHIQADVLQLNTLARCRWRFAKSAFTSLQMVDKLRVSDKIEFVAEVAEQADALRSGRSGLGPVRVQIPPSALGADG